MCSIIFDKPILTEETIKIANKGRIYGIDVKFLEEQDESNNINKFKPEYITASIDTENLKM